MKGFDGCPDGRDGLRPSGESSGARWFGKAREMMAQTFTGRKRVRKFFGKIQEVAEMPNLIEVQKASYDQFLLVQEPVGGRPDEGLQAVFKSVFPISDFSNTSMLEFVEVRVRSAEIRRRRVPPARHDLRRPAQGDAAPHRVRYRRGDGSQVGQGHQGAGCLHGRHPAHDQQRHLRRQRHRARHRLPDAPLARRVLRSRQGQDPFLGQAVCLPRASFRIAARGSTSSSMPRTSSMRVSTGAGKSR